MRSTFFTGIVERSTAVSPPRLANTPSIKMPTCAAVEPRIVTVVYCPLPFTSRTCTPGTVKSKSGNDFCSPLNSSGRTIFTVPGESLLSQSGRLASTVIVSRLKSIKESSASLLAVCAVSAGAAYATGRKSAREHPRDTAIAAAKIFWPLIFFTKISSFTRKFIKIFISL